MEGKSHYFYVLYCQDDTLYAGYTNSLKQRIDTHNNGKGAKYTRVASRQPVRLIYAERWPSKSQAMSAEYQFKQLTRSAKEQYLSDHGQTNIRSTQVVFYNQYE